MTLPTVPEPFYWIDAPWGYALRCRALDPVAPHLFSTRQLELSSAAHTAALTASVGASRLVQVNQVHGRAHLVVTAGQPVPDARPEADIIVSNAPDAAVAVRAADCVPVLIADRATGAVAAVHAGWRGTCAGASPAAVSALRAEFGSRPEDLVAAIGPSIGVCCYEVGPDLVDAFAAAGGAREPGAERDGTRRGTERGPQKAPATQARALVSRHAAPLPPPFRTARGYVDDRRKTS